MTYIVGANFQRKSTVGSLFNWCLTGTSLYGNEREDVVNDKKKTANVIVDITFVDNYGIEHRLVRNKGKQMNLLLDGKEIKQDILSNFYHDKDIFLVSHNPYYFPSLEPKIQKELVRKIIPAISKEDSFELLTKNEQKIIGKPIELLGSYIDKRNEAINELQKEYDESVGRMQAYRNIALGNIQERMHFDKADELEELQKQYETIVTSLGDSNFEDLKHSIDRLDKRMADIVEDKLKDIKQTYDRENEKLKNVDSEKAICPTCRNEIDDNERKEYLKQSYMNTLNSLQEKSNKLKEEFIELQNEKEKKQELLNKLKTMDIQRLQEEKESIKSKIEVLEQEKNNIMLYNKEVEMQEKQIKEAKYNIEIQEKAMQEILNELELEKKQKMVANKLKRLVIEEQKEQINKYLDKVDLQFCRENKTNDKITECCDIYYEGREYKKSSKSQQARACLEISNLFNNLSGIKAPIFLDDSESITDIQELAKTQMVVSLVIKYNPLEILYDYNDVLDRKKKSLEREIAEKSNFVIAQAA